MPLNTACTSLQTDRENCRKLPFQRTQQSQHFEFRTVVVVITPPFLRDGGTARTAIQVHAVNLVDIRLGKDGSPFRTSHE